MRKMMCPTDHQWEKILVIPTEGVGNAYKYGEYELDDIALLLQSISELAADLIEDRFGSVPILGNKEEYDLLSTVVDAASKLSRMYKKKGRYQHG